MPGFAIVGCGMIARFHARALAEVPGAKLVGLVSRRAAGARKMAEELGLHCDIYEDLSQALARRGCAVLCTFLRVDDPADPRTPQAYRDHRAQDAAAVVARIAEDGGMAAAVEADLSDPATPALLFGTAEEQLGPADILVNNATGWLADTPNQFKNVVPVSSRKLVYLKKARRPRLGPAASRRPGATSLPSWRRRIVTPAGR